MSDLPPSASKAGSSPEEYPDHILKQGLIALKQTDYSTAIEHFSRLSQNRAAPGALRLKANIGWIKALRGNGQIEPAITLCQPLVSHPQAKVQQWARQTLTALKSASGTQVDSAPPESAESTPDDSPATHDLSGFQPLDTDGSTAAIATDDGDVPRPRAFPLSATTSDAVDASGFRPLPSSQTTEESQSADSPDHPPPDSSSPGQFADASSSAAQSATPLPAETTESPVGESAIASSSLFHYERLNQAAAPPEDTAAFAIPSESATSPQGSPPPETSTDEVLAFQYAGRTRPRLQLLKAQQLWPLWVSQAICAIALFWVGRTLLQFWLSIIGRIALFFHNRLVPVPWQWFEQDHTWLTLGSLAALLLASPWLLDWLFQQTAALKPLSIQNLQQTHPEGCRLLRRLSQQRGWLMPYLRELPTDTPLIFSYGWRPRFTRIVISRGLLNRLSDEELATLIGYELTSLTTWTLPWMSLVAVLLQLCYQAYWYTAQWGDRATGRVAQVTAATVSTVCYGSFWLIRKINVPAARSRVLTSDRQAMIWTGNPSALTRAIVKLSSGIAETVVEAGCTPCLVESTDLLLPISYEAAVSVGSLFPQRGFLDALAWDTHNPYRRWLSLNSSHPGLGQRLMQLSYYALNWQLTPELPTPAVSSKSPKESGFWRDAPAFLIQISPYIGPLLGVAVAMVLWFLGGIFEPLGLQRVAWIYGDRSVLWGIVLLGLGMGVMVRINPYFPDITAGNRFQNPPLPSLMRDPFILPTYSQPVRLEGRLLGRPGMANWLCQDFILETPTGLLKLHFSSALGVLGNLLTHPQHPSQWVGRPVEVQGWYRRGAIAWLDIDCFLKSGRVVTQANHPMWAVAISLGSCALGIIILLRG